MLQFCNDINLRFSLVHRLRFVRIAKTEFLRLSIKNNNSNQKKKKGKKPITICVVIIDCYGRQVARLTPSDANTNESQGKQSCQGKENQLHGDFGLCENKIKKKYSFFFSCG